MKRLRHWAIAALLAVAYVTITRALAEDDLDAQAKCAAQAEREFQKNWADPDAMMNYESHYNVALKKCFVLVNKLKKRIISKSLLDAYGRQTYAHYMWSPDLAKAHAVVCELTPSYNKRNFCQSEDEFNTFVARYME